MRFKRVVWGPPKSFIFGWHYGMNPVSAQRFLCVGLGLFNLDFELRPYGLNEKSRNTIAEAHMNTYKRTY